MKHVLIYERQDEGHHLPYLKLVLEAFTAAGVKVTLCLDLEGKRLQHAEAFLSAVIPRTTGRVECGALPAGNTWQRAVSAWRTAGCEHLFFNCFDEVASPLLRRAAFGLLPDRALSGRVSGIYVRCRSLDPRIRGHWLKKAGMRRMLQRGYFHRLLVLDESVAQLHGTIGHSIGFLPDPWHSHCHIDCTQARAELGLKPDAIVVLHYGHGNRRKGLHLLLQACSQLDNPDIHILCAGQIANDPSLRRSLDGHISSKRATHLDRFLNDREEALCFAACDVVALPYIGHYGSSGILPRAAVAGKPVIASGEGLIGQRVRQYGLGMLHTSGNADSIASTLQAMVTTAKRGDSLVNPQNLESFARQTSPQNFRDTLIRHLI